MTYFVPGTQEKDPSKVIMSLQQVHEKTATNATSIATNTTDIATNTTAIATLNASRASTSTFGLAKVDGTTITASGGVLSLAITPSQITNSLGADVLLNNTAAYFDGPSVAQGTSGTWFATGTVTLTDTAGSSNFHAKLWDGTTVIASGISTTAGGTSFFMTITLSGYLASPAGNIRISVKDATSTNGKILFNQTGNSKDSTITAYRIA